MSVRKRNKRWVVWIMAGLLVNLMNSVVFADGQIHPDSTGFKGYYITTKGEWERAKAELRLNPEIRGLSPNFAKSALILATWGEKPSAGYLLEITDVVVESNTAIVKVRLTPPAKDAFTAAVLTYPADAKIIDLAQTGNLSKMVFQEVSGTKLAELQLTPVQTYTVRRGESLWEIAKTFGRRSQEQIMDFVHQALVWNNLEQIDSLAAGQKIVVPGRIGAQNLLQTEEALFTALQDSCGSEVIGYGFNQELSVDADSAIWVLAASPRMAALKQATVRLGETAEVGNIQDVVSYTSTGPWVRNSDNQIIADVREVYGASVVNFLSLAPNGRYLAVAARGYENLLLVLELETQSFTEIARYPDELVSKVVWSPDSQLLVAELAGAWGRSRLVGYDHTGQKLTWDLENRWPAGYNLANPRWLGTAPWLSFQVEAVGLAVTTDQLTGRWLINPADGALWPAESELGLL